MTKLFRVLRDGTILTGPMSENDCMTWLHKNQNMSTDWAIKYEGYSIEQV